MAAAKRRVDTNTMCRIAMSLGMCSIMTATVFWDTEQEFTHAALNIVASDLQVHLPELWNLAAEEADAVVTALAKVAIVAKKYAPRLQEKRKASTFKWSGVDVQLPLPGR